jgi:hypothetical protein
MDMMSGYITELCDAFRVLGIAKRFYDVACSLGLEADKEMLGGDIEKIRIRIKEIEGREVGHV